jgi:hypothetical protein
MIADALEGFFHVDGKFFKTVRYLFARPGFLTRDFIDGRRVRYAHPLRFYLFASFLFFATSFAVSAVTTHQATAAEVASAKTNTAKVAAVATGLVNHVQTTFTSASSDEVGHPGQSWSRSLFIRKILMLNSDLDPRAVKQEFGRMLPTLLFFALPILALVLMLAYARSGRFYVEHLVFALHLQGFVFLSLLVIMAGRALGSLIGDTAESWVGIILSMGMVWMIYRALLTAYGQSRSKTAVKLAMVSVGYGVFLLMGLLAIRSAAAYLVWRSA